MALDPSEYDMSYFDGRLATYRHNAGYSKYERWYRNEGEGSRGEFWKDLTQGFFDQYAANLSNKQVLDIGCAKGFFVEDLRELGVDAYGLDCSQYAYDAASPSVQPYLTVGDARSVLSTYSRNQWDVIVSMRFLVCISEADLPALIAEMNRCSRLQIHVIDEQPNANFYVAHPLSWWAEQGFARGTRLVSQETGEVVVV